MDYLYNILQTGAIIAHFVTVILRLSNRKKIPIKEFILSSSIQVFLIVFLVRDLSNQWLINKEWIWYLLDYMLAAHFLINHRLLTRKIK